MTRSDLKPNAYYEYLWEVLTLYKLQLGGGSAAIVFIGVFERALDHPLSWQVYIWLLAAVFVLCLMHHGVRQRERTRERIAIRSLHRRVYKLAGPIKGVEFYFDVVNLSETESLEGIRAELVAMSP